MVTSPLEIAVVVALLALAIDAATGEPRWLWSRISHPVVAIGALVTVFDRTLNRTNDSIGRRRAAGFLTVAATVGVAAGTAWAVVWVTRLLPMFPATLIEALIASTLIAQRSLSDHIRAVANGLNTGGLQGGRAAVAQVVGRDPASLDEAGVCRAAIESNAENYADGVTAPLFWLLLGGLPGLVAYKAINTLDSMIGHRNSRYEAFGLAAARLDDLVNWPAARLTALIFAAAALLTPGADPVGALKASRHDARLHRSINAGWPEAAMAGALGIALAGPRRYAGREIDDAWMNRNGRAEATSEDIATALRITRISTFLLALALVAVLAWLRQGS